MPTSNVALITQRIDYKAFYFLIVPDMAAGRKDAYTVYRIPSSPSRRIKVIARECDLDFCKKLCKNYNKPPTKKQKAIKKIADRIIAKLKTPQGKAALEEAGKASRQRAEEMADRTRFDWMDR